MALQKTKSTNMGVDGNYWRIVQLNMNYDRLDAVCTVACYKDETVRNNGSQPLTQVQFDLSNSFHNDNYTNGEDTMKNISLKEAYKVLKSLAVTENAKEERKDEDLAFFSDAIDC